MLVTTHHKSRTHEFFIKYNLRIPEHLTPHRHYRLVLDTIGRKLENFRCSWEMVNAVYAALVAHEAAYNIGILHRDISVGNIMIVDNEDAPNLPGGILIDWDLCKFIDPRDKHYTPRHTRTGTWLFMAADLIESPETPQTFTHDLESAFWGLMWLVLSYMQTDWPDTMRSSFLQSTMSPLIYGDRGGPDKSLFLESDFMPDLKIRNNAILYEFLYCLKKTLGVRYRTRPSEPSEPSAWETVLAQLKGKGQKAQSTEDSSRILNANINEYDILMDCLKDHQIILTMFRVALADRSKWPTDDAAIEQYLIPPRAARRF